MLDNPEMTPQESIEKLNLSMHTLFDYYRYLVCLLDQMSTFLASSTRVAGKQTLNFFLNRCKEKALAIAISITMAPVNGLEMPMGHTIKPRSLLGLTFIDVTLRFST